jgi:hypothetical protein
MYSRREISSARKLAIKIVRLIRPLSAIEASMLIKVLKQARALYEVVWGETIVVARLKETRAIIAMHSCYLFWI